MAEYPFMPLAHVLKHVPEMERLGVSEVARSARGFLTAYRAAGTSAKLPAEWRQKRVNFIKRTLVQYKANPTYRRWLALVAWAFYIPPNHG